MLRLLGLQRMSFKRNLGPLVFHPTLVKRGVGSIDPKVFIFFIWYENSRKKLLSISNQNHSWKIWKSGSRSSSSSSSSKSSASGLRTTCPEYLSLPVRPAGDHAASARPAVYELKKKSLYKSWQRLELWLFSMSHLSNFRSRSLAIKLVHQARIPSLQCFQLAKALLKQVYWS